MPDSVCAHTSCVVSEPSRLFDRRVAGSDFVETYCGRHDPLEDPRTAEHFEAP